MWDKTSIYPKIETGCTFGKHMNNELVEKLNNKAFTQVSAILKIKYFNPKNIIVQHLLLKKKKRKLKSTE